MKNIRKHKPQRHWKKIIGPIFVLDFNRSGIFRYRFKFVRQKAAVVIKIHLLTKTVNTGGKSNAATSKYSLMKFWICRVCSHRQVKFRIEFHWLLKTTKSKFFVNESVCDWLKNLGWPRLKSLHCNNVCVTVLILFSCYQFSGVSVLPSRFKFSTLQQNQWLRSVEPKTRKLVMGQHLSLFLVNFF